MSNASDFIIENGVLTKYVGPGGDVVIPEGVTEIGFRAFYNNNSITGVNLPNGLESIGLSAFSGNTLLSEITLPEGLITIEQDAFYGCSSLKTIRIPASVEKLGEWHADVFRTCSNLESIEVAPDNRKYKSVDGVLYSKTLRNLHFCPAGMRGVLEIPHSVTTINAQAFLGCQFVSEVVVPDKIKKIGFCCFYDCKMLRKISMPANLEVISESAFEGCESLQNVILPESLVSIETRAFAGCSALREITLPSSVGKLGSNAFENNVVVHCTSDQFKKLPEGVRLHTICEYLHYTDDLSDDRLELVSKYLKKYKDQLLELIIDADDALSLGAYLDMQKKITLDTLSYAIEKASSGDHRQTLIFLTEKKNQLYPPEKVGTLEEERLEKFLGTKERSASEWREIFKYSCKNGEITISGYKDDDPIVEVPAQIGKNRVTAIGSKAFYDCQHIKQVFLPDTIKVLEEHAFYYCRNLQSVVIPEGVEVIGDSSFESCESLLKVDIPRSVNHIGRRAFCCCHSLVDVTIPDGIKVIERNTFQYCKNLKTLSLPESIESVGENAFQGCCALADSDGYLIVKNTLYGYNGDASDVVIPSSVVHIDARVFSGRTQIHSVTICEGVVSVGMAAFSSCTNLKEVYLPASITSMASNVFFDCPNLIVRAPAGSYAEQYAKENNIPFVAE